MKIVNTRFKHTNLIHNHFSKAQLVAFVTVFACIGGLVLLQGRAVGACTQTISPGTSLATVINNAASGTTICLNSGDYGNLILNSVTHNSDVVIQPAGGATVNFSGGFTLSLITHLHFTGTGGTMNVHGMDEDPSNGPSHDIAFDHINWTDAVTVRTDGTGPQNILFDSNTFYNIDAALYEGRLSIKGSENTSPVGVTITNNKFGQGGCSDGIQIVGDAYGVQIGPGNDFSGITQGSCASHNDPIQFYGERATVVTGNYFHDNGDGSGGIMSPDGDDGYTITNNVFNETGAYPYAVLMGGCSPAICTVTHNTFVNADLGIGTSNGGTHTLGAVARDNVFASGGTIDTIGTGNTFTATYNLNSGVTGTGNITGTPIFAGGASPTTYAGFALSGSSPGHKAASDGTDMGITITPTANVWVSTTGNDTTCVRGDQTKPCLSFNKAYQIAQSGDVIEVGGGTYIGPEYVYYNPAITSKVIFRPAQGASINIQDASGHGQPVFIKASHVEFDDFPFGYQEFAGAGACGWSCPSHTYGLQIAPPSGANGSYACISDIVIRNASGHSFSVNNGVSDVSFIGGTWGNLGWRPGETSDLASSWNAPAIGGSTSFKCPDSSTTGTAVTNITFDGVRFGNNFQGCQDSATYGANPQSTCVEPTHPDCLHVFGETVGLTIKNSWFDHCMGFYLNLNVENNYAVDGQARIKDALFENNFFGDDNAGGYDSWNQLAPAGTGPLYAVCDNVVFRNNTWGHDQSPNPLFAINCPLAAGASTGVQFYDNIFTNWGSSACPSGVTFDHNLFISGSTCGTNALSGSAAFKNPADSFDKTFVWAATPWTSDFHIDAGSLALNTGDPAHCSSTDIDGDSRPQGTACDMGADESAASGSIQGDLNNDGHVDITDLSILLSHYGQSATASQGDINSSGTCDITDLSILLSHYGT